MTTNSGSNSVFPPADFTAAQLAEYGYGSGMIGAALGKMSPRLFDFINEEQELQSELSSEAIDSANLSGESALTTALMQGTMQGADGGVNGYSGLKGADMVLEQDAAHATFNSKRIGLEKEINLSAGKERPILRMDQNSRNFEGGGDGAAVDDFNDPIDHKAVTKRLVREKQHLTTDYEHKSDQLRTAYDVAKNKAQAMNGISAIITKPGESLAQKNNLVFQSQQSLQNQNSNAAEGTQSSMRSAIDSMMQAAQGALSSMVAVTG